MKKIVSLLIIIVLLASCNEYQKALKSEDPAVKLVMATKMYEAKNYNKAIRIFEQIISVYRVKP
jgi:outer membrane protein assembly factor BamD